jgi:hypothetical protein
MVRVARSTNTSVFNGVDNILELPFDLLTAFQHASTILNWFENVPQEEQPPDWMWPFPDEVSQWFDEVKLAREQKYSNDADGGDLDDWDTLKNDAAEGRGK